MGRRSWIVLLAALALIGIVVPAQAAGGPDGQVGPEARARHAAAVTYWTAERIAAAVPALPVIGPGALRVTPLAKGDLNCNKAENRDKEECLDGGGGGGDDGSTGDVNCNKRSNRDLPECAPDPGTGDGGGSTTPVAPTTGAPWIVTPDASGGVDDVRHITGKVLFTLGTTDYVCSGSVVTDGDLLDDRALVVTAGHCTHEGDGATLATNWTFVPYFDADIDGSILTCGDSPYGCWTATALVTTADWAAAGHFDYDVGFAVLEYGGHSGSEALEDVLTSRDAAPADIGFNRPRGEYVAAFGYPHAAPYDGDDLIHCAGDAIPYHWYVEPILLFSYSQGLSCDQTGGTSGGPWYADFDAVTGTGIVMSVNSYKMTTDPDTIYGTFFGNYAEDTYVAATTATSDTYVPRPADIP